MGKAGIDPVGKKKRPELGVGPEQHQEDGPERSPPGGAKARPVPTQPTPDPEAREEKEYREEPEDRCSQWVLPAPRGLFEERLQRAGRAHARRQPHGPEHDQRNEEGQDEGEEEKPSAHGPEPFVRGKFVPATRVRRVDTRPV